MKNYLCEFSRSEIHVFNNKYKIVQLPPKLKFLDQSLTYCIAKKISRHNIFTNSILDHFYEYDNCVLRHLTTLRESY